MDSLIDFQVTLAYEPWNYEPSLVRMPWNSEAKHMQVPSKLKIGIVWDDGAVQPHPPVMRALNMAFQALTDAGHEVVDWNTTSHREIQENLVRMFFLDAGKDILDALELGNEGPVEVIRTALSRAPPKPFTLEETWKVRHKAFRTTFLLDRFRWCKSPRLTITTDQCTTE